MTPNQKLQDLYYRIQGERDRLKIQVELLEDIARDNGVSEERLTDCRLASEQLSEA